MLPVCMLSSPSPSMHPCTLTAMAGGRGKVWTALGAALRLWSPAPGRTPILHPSQESPPMSPSSTLQPCLPIPTWSTSQSLGSPTRTDRPRPPWPHSQVSTLSPEQFFKQFNELQRVGRRQESCSARPFRVHRSSPFCLSGQRQTDGGGRGGRREDLRGGWERLRRALGAMKSWHWEGAVTVPQTPWRACLHLI